MLGVPRSMPHGRIFIDLCSNGVSQYNHKNSRESTDEGVDRVEVFLENLEEEETRDQRAQEEVEQDLRFGGKEPDVGDESES